MKLPPGAWLMLRPDLHDRLVAEARTCSGGVPAWWHEQHPFVVMDTDGDWRLVCPICRDPRSKDTSAEPVEILRGDGEAAYDTFLHVEIALWVRVANAVAYVGGPFRRPVSFRPHLTQAYRRAFTETWGPAALQALPRAD